MGGLRGRLLISLCVDEYPDELQAGAALEPVAMTKLAAIGNEERALYVIHKACRLRGYL
jgi:hypothetical protein